VAVFKDHKKDPDATLDWIFDWNDWLSEAETISDSEFILDPGISIDPVKGFTNTMKTTTVWLTGGTEGQVYRVTNRITTSEGRIDDRSFTLRCTNR
jgi:hypothetical protein